MLSKGILRRVFYIINLGFAAGLGLSVLSSFISPEIIWMLAFMGIAFPILLIINIFFILYWLLTYPRRAFISGIFLLLALPGVCSYFQIGIADDVLNYSPNNNEIKLMSFNVRLFDLYNWTNNKTTRNKIIDLVREADAGIMCFQEFFHEDTGIFNTLDTLKRVQKARNVHIEYTAHVKNVNHWGIATFSKYPIINKGTIKFRDSTDNISIYSDIRIDELIIRVYNLHLESIRFRSEDYKALKSITGKDDDTKLGGPQKIIGRMRKAYIRRARQAELIKESVEQSPYPVIICGDFNDPPTSYSYQKIANGFEDTFKEKGAGFGTTYVGLMPFLRIDYILYQDNFFEAVNHQVLKDELSDHHPILSTLKIVD